MVRLSMPPMDWSRLFGAMAAYNSFNLQAVWHRVAFHPGQGGSLLVWAGHLVAHVGWCVRERGCVIAASGRGLGPTGSSSRNMSSQNREGTP